MTNAEKKRYLREMEKDLDSHFKSKISSEAGRYAKLGRNGYEQLDMKWGEAYRKGKVTAEDYRDVRKAAAETRAYAKAKYGKESVDALAKSGTITIPAKKLNRVIVENGLRTAGRILRDPMVLSDGSDDYSPWDERVQKSRKGGNI